MGRLRELPHRNLLPSQHLLLPALDEELCRSRGLDPAWGPVSQVVGSCVSDIEPIPDSHWIEFNKHVWFLWDQSCVPWQRFCASPTWREGDRGRLSITSAPGSWKWSSWGLTEVKEDILRTMRDREEEDKLCERTRLLGAQEFEGYFDMEPYWAML
ncbi:hypothetical protein QBC32DRAFT_50565 [Pseudoneurospora amorphoporcata]|uniref:Uncharacterized protein n=1 Tax=Pseudoneurospora amorphoporcata TaxID=241081 RepID=A0AAN6NN85_9PEZI|nr:hypothetical protein QBC32DRAFT_50565 [Pseudoneurospora amorphoporcata]